MHKIFALTRFSFLPSDNRGFRLTKNLSFDEKRKVLFSAARMERRFEVFERVCLPSLVAQPADAFGAVLLASDLMPDQYRERLEALLAPHPNLLPTFESPRPAPYSEAFLKPLGLLDQVGDIIMTCRLDDDDALSANFTQQALSYIEPSHVGYCVSFPRGLQAAKVEGEPRFWESYYPLIGAGLGYIAWADSGLTIHDCGHHEKVWENTPTIVDGRSPQYLVTLHDKNDSTSRTAQGKKPWWKWPFRRGRRTERRHRNELRNPPEDAFTLEQARAQYGDSFTSLAETDWSFL